jgi:hypothetical protein
MTALVMMAVSRRLVVLITLLRISALPTWCDKQAYVVAEFDYKPGAPVGAVKVDKGIAFELCACSG